MTTVSLMRESIKLVLVYRFRGLVHYCHGRKHGAREAAESSIYGVKGSKQEESNTGPGLSICNLKVHPQ